MSAVRQCPPKDGPSAPQFCVIFLAYPLLMLIPFEILYDHMRCVYCLHISGSRGLFLWVITPHPKRQDPAHPNFGVPVHMPTLLPLMWNDHQIWRYITHGHREGRVLEVSHTLIPGAEPIACWDSHTNAHTV